MLTLTPEALKLAKQQNLSILSFLANQHSAPVISYLGPIIALLAIVSSFFGHYQGAREGLKGLVISGILEGTQSNKCPHLDQGITIFFLLSLWGVAVLNPSILGMIESLSGPIIALILFIMPVYARYRVPALRGYLDIRWDGFIVIVGGIAISAIFYNLIR